MFWKKKSDGHACCQVLASRGPATIQAPCSDEACYLPEATTGPAYCPVSGTLGRKVDLITVKALLNATALRHLDGQNYRFCPASDCDLVYFDNVAGSVFGKNDLTVRVGQKERKDPVPLCYCFDFTAADIRRDLALRGRTDIPAIITAAIKSGHCACEVKNPEGRCCLGNVAKAVKRIQAEPPLPSPGGN